MLLHKKPQKVYSLVENRSIVDWDHLFYEVARVQHRNPYKPLDYQLRLEEVLTFFMKTLKNKTQNRIKWSFKLNRAEKSSLVFGC